jgi:hypothetical protein
MRPGPSSAKTILVGTIPIDAEPKPAVDWLAEISIAQGWHSTNNEALEAAERWEDRFLDLLRDELSDFNRLGRFAPFDFNSSSDYLIQGCAFVEPRDSDEAQEAKRRRSQYHQYTAALKCLSAREFESLCAGLLQAIGVEDPQITPYSADEGIDFYGRLKLERFVFSDSMYPGIQQQLSIWMIGQAKHYDAAKVSTFEIRERVGTVQLAKSRAFGSSAEKYSDLRLRECDPVFYLFFTTGRITLNSWELIARCGVAAMDGNMIAAFLADRAIGTDDESRFQEEAFKNWIAECGDLK